MLFALRFASGVSVWVSGFVCGFVVLSLPLVALAPLSFFMVVFTWLRFWGVYVGLFVGLFC
jgi:hypothetical protein